jgi:hypothetical protein
MFGLRLSDTAQSVEAKEQRLRDIGRKIEQRTNGKFKGIQFANDFITNHDIVGVVM